LHSEGLARIGHSLPEAMALLCSGQLVAIPTETVYGLAADATNEEAVLRIFAAKGRPAHNPLIVHVASKAALAGVVAALPEEAELLADAFWPGPLALVLPKAAGLAPSVTAGKETVAVRVPAHPMALALLHALPFPLAAPSANPSGKMSPTDAQHVALGFTDQQVGLVLDGGPTYVGLESTIVGFDADGKAEVLRLGGTSLEDLILTLGYVPGLRTEMTGEAPDAPGMLSSHYAPSTPLKLGDLHTLVAQHSHLSPERIGILALSKTVPGIPFANQVLLSPNNGYLPEAAKRLFSSLRKLDMLSLEVILAEPVAETGIGRAINDRLRRAAV